MRCDEVMTRQTIVVTRDDTAEQAARIMRERGFGFLPVCEADGRAVGTITDRDLVVRGLAREAAPGTRVGDLMTCEVVSCGPEDDLREAEAIMAHRQKSRIMVCDDDARVLGVISLSDVAQLEAESYAGFMLRRVTRREVDRPTSAHAVRCADVMKHVVVCVAPNESVAQAARLMRDNDVGFLPLCESGDGGVVNVVTDRDLATWVVADGRPAGTLLRDVLPQRDVVTCRPDDPLTRVEELMATHRKARLPVCDPDGLLIGVISLSDVARHASPEGVGATLRDVTAREAG